MQCHSPTPFCQVCYDASSNYVVYNFCVYFQCCEMLDYLGVPYVHSPGEAEATCAALNASGVSKLMSCLIIVVLKIVVVGFQRIFSARLM